jgi:hypothetical protein
MEWEVGAAQHVVNESSKRLEDESKKLWDLMCLAVLSFIEQEMMGLDVLSGAQLYMRSW